MAFVDYANVDKRGAQVDYSVIPTNGWEEDYEYLYEATSLPIDITNYTFTLTLSNDTGAGGDYARSSNSTPYSSIYTATITDAVAGTFNIKIPASYFTNIWGDEVIYTITSSDSGGIAQPFAWGVLTLEQIR